MKCDPLVCNDDFAVNEKTSCKLRYGITASGNHLHVETAAAMEKAPLIIFSHSSSHSKNQNLETEISNISNLCAQFKSDPGHLTEQADSLLNE